METTAHVQKRRWDINDEYLVVEAQLDSSEFKSGDKVKITIEKI